jgi:D-alanine-D-alanine ligase
VNDMQRDLDELGRRLWPRSDALRPARIRRGALGGVPGKRGRRLNLLAAVAVVAVVVAILAVPIVLGKRPGFPMYVKPRRLGSSIGVARVDNDQRLREALEVAFDYDTSVLAEEAQDDSIEINCSVLGFDEDVRVSVCEQPVSTGTLSYADKYLSGAKGKGGAKAPAAGMKGAQRIIPAPISESLTGRIQDTAMSSFRAIGAAGVTRVDFLVSPERDSFVVNELNTLPGSLSFYLWEASGLRFEELLARLVEMAMQRHREQQATTSSIDTWLLTGRPG